MESQNVQFKVRLKGSALTSVVVLWAIVVSYFVILINEVDNHWLMYGFGVFMALLVIVITRMAKALALAEFSLQVATRSLELISEEVDRVVASSSGVSPLKGTDDNTIDIGVCPECGGPADNGHDRCYPPNPYVCTKCEHNSNEE